MHGDDADHLIAVQHGHAQPAQRMPANNLQAQDRLQGFQHVLANQQRLPGAENIFGQPVAQWAAALGQPQPVLNFEQETDFGGFCVVKRDVDVGGIQQARGIAVNGIYHFLYIQLGREVAAHFVQNGQLFGAQAGFFKQAGVFQGERELVSNLFDQQQFILGPQPVGFVEDFQRQGVGCGAFSPA